jgi:hypothetical protein
VVIVDWLMIVDCRLWIGWQARSGNRDSTIRNQQRINDRTLKNRKLDQQ